jgi:hypothetical protein
MPASCYAGHAPRFAARFPPVFRCCPTFATPSLRPARLPLRRPGARSRPARRRFNWRHLPRRQGRSHYSTARPDSRRATSTASKSCGPSAPAGSTARQPTQIAVQPARHRRRALRHHARRSNSSRSTPPPAANAGASIPHATVRGDPRPHQARREPRPRVTGPTETERRLLHGRRALSSSRSTPQHRPAASRASATAARRFQPRARPRSLRTLALQSTTPGRALRRPADPLHAHVGEGPGPSHPATSAPSTSAPASSCGRFNTIPVARRVRPRHLAAGRVALRRRRQRLGRLRGRRESAGCVFCTHRLGRLRLLGRQPHRPEPLWQLPARLDARTGRTPLALPDRASRLWDRDLPAPPNLVTVGTTAAHRRRRAGDEVRPRLRLSPRDRRAALPDREVAGAVVGSPRRIRLAHAAAAAPKPAPFSRQLFTYDDLTDIARPPAHRAALDSSPASPHGALPAAEPRRHDCIFPGFDGGAEWGGAATDPDGVLYVNANEMAWIIPMIDAKTKGSPHGFASGRQSSRRSARPATESTAGQRRSQHPVARRRRRSA